jgi:hypothetical protein
MCLYILKDRSETLQHIPTHDIPNVQFVHVYIHTQIGTWRRATRPRVRERPLLPRMSAQRAIRFKQLLGKTWLALKMSKPRQFCSIWKQREKYWDK